MIKIIKIPCDIVIDTGVVVNFVLESTHKQLCSFVFISFLIIAIKAIGLYTKIFILKNILII